MKNAAEKTFCIEAGAVVGDALPAGNPDGGRFVAALVNNEAVTLGRRLPVRAACSGLTLRDDAGWLAFRRTMCFMLFAAAREACPGLFLRVGFSMGRGVFAAVRDSGKGDERPVSRAEFKAISSALRALVARDEPIREELVSYGDALKLFKAAGRDDELNLMRHMNRPAVVLQRCGEICNLHVGPMLRSTGDLRPVSLRACRGGLLLLGPSREDPSRVARNEFQPALFTEHAKHARWGDVVNLRCIGDLNEAVSARRENEVIETDEARHRVEFARMAREIVSRRTVPRIVLIAGPSSAGKTTSCARLSVQLRVQGLHPVALSTDDYFRPTEEDPIGPDGKPDFEDIRAVDVPALERDLLALLAGRSVRRRTFDFLSQKPVWKDERIGLGENSVICIEGIHALNPLLTKRIPDGEKFRIFLSALTSLSVDDASLLSTSDNRLIRRIVRDNAFRGHDAKSTISMWPAVRRGEEKWIFPFQDTADATFNSSLDYELAVLRPYAEALLSEVKPSDSEYAVARRLQGVLRHFHPIPPTRVPPDSILRETIGGSSFSV